MGKVSKFAPGGSTFKTVFYVSIFSFMTKFYRAFAMGYTNTAGESFKRWINAAFLQRGIQLSVSMSMWLWSMELNSLILGDFIGTIFTPFLTDRIGRRATLLVANIGVTSASLLGSLSIVSGYPELFLLTRIFGATMASINFGALILLLMECPTSKLRGTCYFISGTAFKAVVVVGLTLGMEIVLGRSLVLLVGLGAIPSMICILMILMIKETPKFLLVSRKDKEAAVKSLMFYQGSKVDVEKILDETLKEEEDASQSTLAISAAIKELFYQPHLRRAITVGFCALHLQVGIWPMTTEILSAHYSEYDAEIYSAILFASNFCGGLFGALIISRVSRRKMLIGSSVVNTLALAAYVLFDRLAFYWWPSLSYAGLASMLFYNVSYGMGVGSIAPYINAELLPQLHRSVGQSVVYCVGLAISFTISLVMVPAFETYDVWVFVPLFIIPNAFCVVYLVAYLPETRGREIHEIVEELKRTCGVNLVKKLSQISMKRRPSSKR